MADVGTRAPAEPVVTLTAGDAVVTVHPDSGGRVGQITVAGTPLLVDVPDADARHPLSWGAYVMAPWAGRLRQGRFARGGNVYHVAINHHDGDGPHRAHAIHGTVWERPWTLTSTNADTATLECALTGALDWPFAGTVRHELVLHADRLVQRVTLESAEVEFPAEVGWHPWFAKPQRLVFNPNVMYRRDAYGIPTGELVPVTDGPWDDCFVNVEPVRLHYDRDVASTVTVLSDCQHWVVFDALPHATCVEPQSGPPNAFNLVHHVVVPGAPLRRTMTIAW